MKEKNNRQLAAVMFTDIEGYTAMMQNDEQAAIMTRKRHKTVLENLIDQHRGDILQYYGDGSLSIFDSAIEAVNCAVAIQSTLTQEPRVPLRIGIHTGDIMRDDEGIYGDGVNVASRVESLSVAGGVLISDKVFDEIKNHPQFDTISLGQFELKNVERPIELFALANEGLTVPKSDQLRAIGQSHRKSIAVLPFVNMSSDPENQYFSEGITEEIINMLVKIDGLDVIARTSAFAFKDKNMDIRQIGRELGVSTILEGSVRKAGNRVRITAQLIETADGYHLFSETYDRDLEDIFAVQDEIALLIANKLRENFDKPPKEGMRESQPTENIEAYELYLKGQHSLWLGSPEGIRTSIEYFEKAVKLAPNFALPYTGLSSAYLFVAGFRLDDPVEASEKAKTYAHTAQKLDENLPETHLALARTHIWNDWDLQAAKLSMAHALKLGPGSAEVHATYAFILLIEGKIDDAMVEAQIAKKLDPLSPITLQVIGAIYYASERFDLALELFEQAIEMNPNSLKLHIYKFKILLCTGQFEKAIEVQEMLSNQGACGVMDQVTKGLYYASKGDAEKVSQCVDNLSQPDDVQNREFSCFGLALIHLILHQPDKMFENLEQCVRDKTAPILFLNSDPIFKKYRKDPRFITLVNKILKH